ncbi:WYL domain-containing protein [Limnoraphis robusta]|uniref:WYL domain-containing protein n=1 Tax=Limnoraphis robusta CCNP1315 TaxID=3110306 RepID=A0ABU5TVJ0_9CYAN|nr:WYL domain-containing protein [Limnoraphis robusta]MEA5518912.1 WYL domain-containing protein [Limnoraphis robusta CCNP1315]MEA5548450.1 WYL domain-containing protein [Limnoraphis robusta CCNP1324]
MLTDVHHILMGVPSSGKSTFAKHLAQLDQRYCIVSTDDIRRDLFGDESIQGNWVQVENEVLQRIKNAISLEKLVIYDATNAKRAWRLNFFEKIAVTIEKPLIWMGWHLITPLVICKQWNQNRTRKVPEGVIDELAQFLTTFSPDIAEGFLGIKNINGSEFSLNLSQLEQIIKQSYYSDKARQSRTANYTLHPYSRLLDFERLIYLISLIIQYPGLGQLHETQPEKLQEIFNRVPQFDRDIDEICGVVSHLKGEIYSDKNVIAQDLVMLENLGFFNLSDEQTDFKIHPLSQVEIEQFKSQNWGWHRYSDLEPFQRLMKLIRYIAYHLFQIYKPTQNSSQYKRQTQKQFMEQLQREADLWGHSLDSVQRDIEKVLKPYGILPQFSLKRGYFLGTAIFSEWELKKIYGLLQAQKFHLDDPVAVEMTELFQNRIESSRLLELETVYPTRVIGNRGIVNPNFLPSSALFKNLEQLETAIIEGQLLELQLFRKSGRFPGQTLDRFTAYPLQVVFHNIAWYLGYEIQDLEQKGLLHFEGLDRFSLEKIIDQSRSLEEQQAASKQLSRLYKASSAGIYLGASVEEQKKFLSLDVQQRKSVEIVVELWMSDYIFKFVSEGNQRFSRSQMKMSHRIYEATTETDKTLFSLKPSSDPIFPNRFRLTLPRWSLRDIDLKRWVLGLGGQVKVVHPPEFIQIIRDEGKAITENYEKDCNPLTKAETSE